MKQRSFLTFASVSLIAVLALLGGAALVHGEAPTARRLQATATEVSELPANTPILAFNKPITESLDPNGPGRYYKFEGKANQLITVTLEPKAGTFYTTITILDNDLQRILGGTQGEAIVGGSAIVKLPADGSYVVIVDYADSSIATPTPGEFTLTISEFKSK